MEKLEYIDSLAVTNIDDIVEYIYDMNKRMAEADLIICRAGAMTVSELAAAGKCPIFIPSPNVAENHQYKNAKALSDANACVLVQESELSSGKLEAEAVRLLSDESLRGTLGKNITPFGEPEANRIIYEEIKKLAAK